MTQLCSTAVLAMIAVRNARAHIGTLHKRKLQCNKPVKAPVTLIHYRKYCTRTGTLTSIVHHGCNILTNQIASDIHLLVGIYMYLGNSY